MAKSKALREERLTAEFLQLAVSYCQDNRFPALGMNMEAFAQHLADRAIVSFKTLILKEPENSGQAVNVYASWFDHFLDTACPKWIVRFFKVNSDYRTLYAKQTLRVCPHSTEKWHSNRLAHLVYLNYGGDDGRKTQALDKPGTAPK